MTCPVEVGVSTGYTKYDIWCPLLFGITQQYDCLLHISFFIY